MKLKETLKQISPIDPLAQEECLLRWDSIAKPLHSLGKLEDAVTQIGGITRTPNVNLEKKALVIMCSDNGVVAEGVTQTGSEVTALVAENFLEENACVSIMVKQAGAHVYPIDIGMNQDTKVLNKKIAYGTKNILYEPAMTREQAVKSIETGIQVVLDLKKAGYNIIATGEMGIGNTTTSSAIASVLLDLPVEEVTGKGAGLSEAGLNHKIDVIKKAILVNKPDKKDPIDVLSKVGGFDIGGLVGIYIGGAAHRLPIVMDGFISQVAALIAIRIEPKVRDFILPSHASGEFSSRRLLDTMGFKPYLTCNMHLGEGSGAVALFPLLDMGLAVYRQMCTFEQIKIEPYKPME